MTKVRIYNCSPHSLIIDMRERAIASCDWTKVDEKIAAELVAGPDWQYENPRKPPVRASMKVEG